MPQVRCKTQVFSLPLALTALSCLAATVFVLRSIAPWSVWTRPGDDVTTILRALQSVVGDARPKARKFGVGVNACLDLVVSASRVLPYAGIRAPSAAATNCVHAIDTEEQLAECFAYHFAKGAAGERYVANEDLFTRLVDVAEAASGAEFGLGGNAAIMACKLVETKAASSVLLGAGVGPHTRKMLPKEVTVPVTAQETVDEVHLILEYTEGEVWGGLTAPRANRFILTHDTANSNLTALEAFANAMQTDWPEMVIISGLHMIEGLDMVWRQARLNAVQHTLAQVPRSTPVHLEVASFGDSNLLKIVAETVLPWVDSVGLNEQEIVALSAALGDGPVKDYQPITALDVGLVADCITWMFARFRTEPSRRLSRIHFHSLSFHIVATVNATAWGTGAQSVAAGSLTASHSACSDIRMDSTAFYMAMPSTFTLSMSSSKLVSVDVHVPVYSWTVADLNFELSPVLVCRHPSKTVGLGDRISARGLQFHSFDRL